MVYTPGQPDDPHQPRPAIVVSEDVRNRLRDDVIAVPLFSGGRLGPTRVPLQVGAGGLRRPSIAFCEEVTTLDRDFLGRGPLGKPVSPAQLAEVIRAIRRALGDMLP
jgi:mRNA interferase MazF